VNATGVQSAVSTFPGTGGRGGAISHGIPRWRKVPLIERLLCQGREGTAVWTLTNQIAYRRTASNVIRLCAGL